MKKIPVMPRSSSVLRALWVGLPRDVDEAARAIRELRVELLRVEVQVLSGRERGSPRIGDLAWVGKDGRGLAADRELKARAVEDRPASGSEGDARVVLLGRQARERPRLDRLEPDGAAQHCRERDHEDGE